MANNQNEDRSIYVNFDPSAPEVTEFRRIFTRVARRAQEEKLRTILFTSSEQGEGKTTSASLFAIVACQYHGLRTCLVDADLHRPRIGEMFEVPREPGLAEILKDNYSIETTLKPSRYENLKILTAGGKHPFPSELLLPDRLATTFGKLKLLFDVIVVDAPPLLPVSDSAVLSREVDGVVLVVRAGRTQKDVAVRAKRILDDVGSNVIGVVVNNMEDVLPYYYGHSYYQDSYHAEEGDEPKRPRSEQTKGRRDGGSDSPRPTPRTRAAGSSG
ncbi:MAG: tyrosine protein kinase [Gemmatimonadota bacterium]|nr:MAG: tyrosine protein kinase [Gemmatimonadota bacterium]